MSSPTTIEPEFVEFIPVELHPGILYVSMAFATTAHLCPCGCGNRVVLPLSPAQWHLYFDGEAVSLRPSAGNWQFSCRSHYWIRENSIVWARRWSAHQIEQGQRRDAADIHAHFADQQQKNGDGLSAEHPHRPVAARRWHRARSWIASLRR